MARPSISEVIKIRRQIIALPQSDFEDLLRDIEIIQEMRDDAAEKAAEVKPAEAPAK